MSDDIGPIRADYDRPRTFEQIAEQHRRRVEALDTVERLEAHVATLRAALQKIANEYAGECDECRKLSGWADAALERVEGSNER